MIITNYQSINKVLGRQHSGLTNQSWICKPDSMRNFYSGDTVDSNFDQKKRDGFPTGTNPPYSFILGDKGALLSSTTTTKGLSTVVSGLSMGKALSADLSGSTTMESGMSLIIQLACNALGSSTLSASISGTIQLAASLAGSGNISASLGLLASVVCQMTGSTSMSSNLRGTLSLEANITPFTELSPENLAASVWNAVASSFNSAGTMGEKMNDAGSASNPWTEVIEGSYTAAEVLRLLASVAAGKSTVTGNQVIFRDINDSIDRVDATVVSGERTNVNLDL